MLKSVKDAMLPESSLPGSPAGVALNRDGMSVLQVSGHRPSHMTLSLPLGKTYSNALSRH